MPSFSRTASAKTPAASAASPRRTAPRRREVVQRALHGALVSLEHRGGVCGNSGDGAGLTCQIPQAFFLCEEAKRLGSPAPKTSKRRYASVSGRSSFSTADATSSIAARGDHREASARRPVARSSASARCRRAGQLAPHGEELEAAVHRTGGLPVRPARRAPPSKSGSSASVCRSSTNSAPRASTATFRRSRCEAAQLQGLAHEPAVRRVLPRPRPPGVPHRHRDVSTAATARTPSRIGSSRSRSASRATTARSTRSARTATP